MFLADWLGFSHLKNWNLELKAEFLHVCFAYLNAAK